MIFIPICEPLNTLRLICLLVDLEKAGKSGRKKLMLRPQTGQKNIVVHFKRLQ